MRRLTLGFTSVVLALMPSAAMADGKLPQMDFADPLTGAQVVWMAVIMIVLYLLMSRWGLPQIGAVIEKRANQIAVDLDSARQAKAKAEHAVAELNLAIRNAREASQNAIAEAINAAKARAREQAAELNARLNAQIEQAEHEIDATRAQAIASLPPVAREVTVSLMLRLTGEHVDPAKIDRTLATMTA